VPAFLCVKCFSQPGGNLLSGTIIDRRGPGINFHDTLKYYRNVFTRYKNIF